MNTEECKAHAVRLLHEVVSDPEFGYVYEDEKLVDASEEDLGKIHVLMCEAKATFGWKLTTINEKTVETLESHVLQAEYGDDEDFKCTCGWEATEDAWLKNYGLGNEYRAHLAEIVESIICERELAAEVNALRDAADEVGTWGPSTIPATQALRERADRIESKS